MSFTATLNGSITLNDSASADLPLTKVLAGLSFTGTAAFSANNLLVGTTPLTINLPVSPTQFVYIKNLSGAATVTVTWTPNGGASAVVRTLQAGGAICDVENAVGGGITALSLQASVAATPVEMILAG